MIDTQTASPSTRRRPFGIYAIIVLQVLNILVNFSDFLRSQLGMATTALPNIDNPQVAGVLNVFVALLLIIVIYGLWRYQRWAWFATMIVQGITLVVGIWQYFHGGTPYANLLINALIVFYLNQRDTRQIFEDVPGARQGAVEVLS